MQCALPTWPDVAVCVSVADGITTDGVGASRYLVRLPRTAFPKSSLNHHSWEQFSWSSNPQCVTPARGKPTSGLALASARPDSAGSWWGSHAFVSWACGIPSTSCEKGLWLWLGAALGVRSEAVSRWVVTGQCHHLTTNCFWSGQIWGQSGVTADRRAQGLLCPLHQPLHGACLWLPALCLNTDTHTHQGDTAKLGQVSPIGPKS